MYSFVFKRSSNGFPATNSVPCLAAAVIVIGMLCVSSCLGQATTCKSRQVVEGQIWATEPVKFNVEYVIGYSEKKLSCFEVKEIMDGRGYKVNMTFDVKADGEPQHAEGVFDMDENNIGTVTLNDETNTMFYTSPDIKPNGIILLYVCLNDKQYIMVQYVTELNLRKAADEAARVLTDHPDKYKVDWNNCKPQETPTAGEPTQADTTAGILSSYSAQYIGYGIIIVSTITLFVFFRPTQ